MITLAQLNAATQDAFTQLLGGVFEHSPWVPQRTWPHRPFASVGALHAAMCSTVARAEPADQLALIRAHPHLAGRAAIAGELTQASTQEQRGAGLDRCTPEEFARLTELNAVYDGKFGFPFILAVRGHTRQSIIANLAQRIANTPEDEIAEALRQVERIAALRLADMIAP